MLEYTGERMVPEAADASTFWEHVLRYRFAIPFTRGRRVLDIACGEGYGSAALAAGGAASVIGVDVAEEACAHASSRYGIDARVGSAEAIPLADASVDVVVSFETIEHLNDPARFLEECHRVLAPGGCLVISTPNVDIYHKGAPANPFHVHEMTAAEFHAHLSQGFDSIDMRGQCLPLPKPLTIKGIRRLHTWWCALAAPHMLHPPSKMDRADVISLITRPSTWRDRYDPYRVRRLPPRMLERAVYLVAAAQRKA